MINGNEYTHRNRAEILKGGNMFFNNMISLIDEAVSLIHIQTYIFNDDETGRIVMKALKDATKRNVTICIIADGIASQSLNKHFISEMHSAGIHFRFFEPLFQSRSYYIGRRLHQKIICADKKKAIVGGINIANRYNDLPGNKAWLDFAVYVEGEVAEQINDFCESIWHSSPYSNMKTIKNMDNTFGNISATEKCEIRIRRNDWIRHKNEISGTYLEMLRTAREEVIILCSYFIPGKAIRRRLAAAARRGIRIKVITAGPSDVMIAKRAERWLYDWLLRNNIQLFEYQKNILHGKLAVADRNFITIGSYNVNNISTYASIEFNLDIRDEFLAGKLHDTLTEIIESDCIRITTDRHRKTNNPLKQLNRWFSYQFISITFKLFTLFFKRQS